MNVREWRAVLLWTAVGGLALQWHWAWVEWLGVLAIALVGTPHGAADVLRLRALPAAMPRLARRWGETSLRWLAMLAYLMTTIAVWCAFVAWPVYGLLLFVALSLFHFGRTDAIAEGRGGGIPGIAPAAAVVAIVAPFVFWRQETLRYVSWVGVPADLFSAFTPALAASIVAVVVLVSLVFAPPPRARATALWVSLPVLTLPPAAGFAVYFCALHAMRHWHQLREEGLALPIAPTIVAMTVTSLLGALALYVSWRSAGLDVPIEASVAKVVVMGLAALTVPHMLLDAVLRSDTNRRGVVIEKS
jgi:beta-carotene 15,15'-dioxygenase